MENALKFLSATRLVAWTSNLVLKCVRQRTIMGFLVVELLMGLFLMWWFNVHKRVAFLGILTHHWKTYVFCAVIRVAVASFGLYAVWIRRIRYTKIYYGLFFLSAFVSLWMVVPVHRTRCSCTNYLQCAALATFSSEDAQLLNPHHPPDMDFFRPKRKVAFKEPPADEATAEVLKEEHLHKISVRLLRKTYNSFLQQEEFSDSSALSAARLRPARRSLQAVLQPVFKGTDLDGTTDGSTMSSMDDPFVFFNVTPKNVDWEGTDKPGCEDQPLESKEAANEAQHELNRLANRKKKKRARITNQALKTKLFLCAGDLDCMGVSATVLYKVDGGGDLRLCRHKVLLLPHPRDDRAHSRHRVDQGVGSTSSFFLKNPLAVQTFMEQKRSSPIKLYKYAVRTTTSEKGVKILRELSQNMCLCDEPSESCNYFEDNRGTERSWCWVKKSRIALCLDEGVKMYWDSSSNRAWSFDLCKKAGCECSELGMHPMKLSDPNLNKSLLNPNRLNYGSSCARWNKDDQRPWCYTGWDTMCADRYLRADEWTSHDLVMKAMHMQYESALPCDRPEQEDIAERLHSRCENIVFFVELFMVLSIILYVPLMVIVFKFLSNRCGDEFQTSAQFAVVYSTDDDEESEDEWASGQTAEREVRASQRPP